MVRIKLLKNYGWADWTRTSENARIKIWCLTDLATAQYNCGVGSRIRTDDLQNHNLAL